MAQSEKRATSLEWEAGSSGIVAGTPISATENPLEQQRLHTPDAVPEKAPRPMVCPSKTLWRIGGDSSTDYPGEVTTMYQNSTRCR